MDLQKEISKKIESIKKSNVLNKLVADLNNKFINVPEVNITSRVKELNSALKKMITKGYKSPDQLTDLSGIQVVTRDVKDVYKIADYIKENYNTGVIDDYIKHPKHGYKSYHINVQLDGNINVEYQLKTNEMYRAQNFIHDKIYKNDNIPEEAKKVIMEPLFKCLGYTSSEGYKSTAAMLDGEVNKLEAPGKVLHPDSIKKFTDTCKSITREENSKYLDKLKTDYMQNLKALNQYENYYKKSIDTKFWLNDLDKNTSKINQYNTFQGKIKLFFSKDAKEDFKKASEDLQLDKKFLNDLGFQNREKFESFNNNIDPKELSFMKCEVDCMYSDIEALTDLLNIPVKEIGIEKDIVKGFEHDR